MSPAYLSYLARLGRTHIHPGGKWATDQLLSCLDLHDGLRVLEIGCGTGGTLVRLAFSWRLTLVGVDILPEMLERAARRLWVAGLWQQAALRQADAAHGLPFPDASFDRVYGESVLCFQEPDPARAILAEVFRVLAPGGLCVLNEAMWKSGVPDETVARIHASSLTDFGLCQASRQNWSACHWRNLMIEVGFEVLSAEPLSPANSAKSPFHPRLVLSSLLTTYSRLTSFLSPTMRRKRVHYCAALERHQDDGRSIEARIFVLRKT